MNLLIIPDVGRSYNSVRPEAEIYIGLAKLGHNITIMTDLNSVYVQHYLDENIEVIDLKPGKKVSLTAIKKIKAVIKAKNIDIVYATKSRTIPNATFACMGTKAKMVAYRGTTGGLYKTDISNYFSILNPRIDGVICVAKSVEKHVKSKISKNKHKNVVTIYKGHDYGWYQEQATDLSEINSSDKYFNILCVGSNRPHKGSENVIKAMAYLNDLDNLRLLLVGNGLAGEPFDSLIANNPSKDKIIRTGFRNDVPQLAKAANFTLLPSTRKEGLPRTILESLSSGTPVITSDIDGAVEIITDGENGLVYPANDIKALAQSIRTVYENKALAEKLTHNAPKVIADTFSHQATVKNYQQYFQSLLN
ncbi:MAG: glycosyltransferase family 4 protein [Thalassotalea sp.]